MSKNVILLSGTCSAGKTTVGKILQQTYNYYLIDGDAVKEEIKRLNKQKNIKTKVHWNEIHDEIMKQSLHLKNKNIVITHVILPDKLPFYIEFYRLHKITVNIIILMPSKSSLYTRNTKRTCWSTPTPKKYIDEFYKTFKEHEDIYGRYFLDTTFQKPEETAEIIMSFLK